MKKLVKTFWLVLCLAPAFHVVAYADAVATPVELMLFYPAPFLLIAVGVIAAAVLIRYLRKERDKERDDK